MKKSKLKTILWCIVACLLVFLGALAAFGARWTVASFGDVSVEEIIFHLMVPLEGTDTNVLIDFAGKVLLPVLGVLAVFGILWILRARGKHILSVWRQRGRKELWLSVSRRRKKGDRRKKMCLVPFIPARGLIVSLSAVVCVVGILYGATIVPVLDYIDKVFNESTFIEDHYVDPKDVAVTFPEQKRNLVYIFLESMEDTFMDTAHNGVMEKSLIPNLTALAEQNTVFTGKAAGQFQGSLMVPGTTWTIAGIFSQTSGLPLRLHVGQNRMADYSSFFPGVTSLGTILEDAGYDNWFICGSDVTFGGRKQYLSQHGDYQFLDWPAAKELGYIPEDYKATWGYEDRKLFEFAKNKITELSAQDQPFNVTMLTVDTHVENGYKCPLCTQEFPTQYENAVACSDRQVTEFLTWLSEQDFYQNTTVILAGDHTTMAKGYAANYIPDDYQRSTYNLFLNPAAEASQTENRLFTNMDMFPTTLAALGCEIEGNRLALGTNLFSDEKTLVEEYGYDSVSAQLKNGSRFYDNKFMYGKE